MEETERVRFLAMDSAVIGPAAVPAVGRTDAARSSLQERLVERTLRERCFKIREKRGDAAVISKINYEMKSYHNESWFVAFSRVSLHHGDISQIEKGKNHHGHGGSLGEPGDQTPFARSRLL